MLDISEELREASQHRRDRSGPVSERLLVSVREAVDGRIYWDDGAGEDWATVMVGDDIAAHVLMLAPLVVAGAPFRAEIEAAVQGQAPVVTVRDMDDDDLRADEDALHNLFGDRVQELNGFRFSANDLWFYSI